jgi:glycosyltransferase involved in cell wall biosynthesis
MHKQLAAKVVHDDLNGGGGSEYLATVTISALNEMGFEVDLASFREPNIKELARDFGAFNIDIRSTELLDIFALLNIDGQSLKSSSREGNRYDLVINTHGDLLPYYEETDGIAAKNLITYCHFPLVPKLVEEGSYVDFLKKWSSVDLYANRDLRNKALSNASRIYDEMMQNGTVLTNSRFSRAAIRQQYDIEPTVVYPPVHVSKFHRAAADAGPADRQDAILVLSRFSPDKQIENAIRVADVLKHKQIAIKMTLAGNISDEEQGYLRELEKMIESKHLEDAVSIEVDVSFSRLLELMQRSKVLLHPLAGEPFGIAIVEAMSAGLIPVVPYVGGNTEFVPSEYHFHSFEEAADIIKHAFAADGSECAKMGEIASRFSTDNYKGNLRSVIRPLVPRSQALA